MVAGYFLYEQFFLGVAAVGEIPIHIGQMSVGLIVSIPIVRAVGVIFPHLELNHLKFDSIWKKYAGTCWK